MSGLKVDVWLEDVFPGTSQVEAIVGPFAVEHTSCDTFYNQRTTGHWFDEVVTPIEQLLSPTTPGWIRIYLPAGSISRGANWAALRNALAVWIARDAGVLPDGTSEVAVPGTDLTVRVWKDSKGTQLLKFWLEAEDEPPLEQRLRDAVLRKAAKLAPHGLAGRTRVLLLESPSTGLTLTQWAFQRMPPFRLTSRTSKWPGYSRGGRRAGHARGDGRGGHGRPSAPPATVGLIFHSDRGSEYLRTVFRHHLAARGVR